ncbi:uncharacterized protein C20orf96-like [Mytilus californianus]|uniref:uncharacterized protein C20orf96-like n=1 Tax=Mytilus californianus TaxID=6549 RepID=UPI002247AB63|nr:uncharacterized protein C20orf96-like [Mytilus californianus]
MAGAPAKDDLMKTLDSKLEFADYEQWTRRSKPSKTLVKPDASKSFLVGLRAKSAEPSKGIHVPTYREKKEAAKQAELDKGRTERIKILELRIKTRKRTNEEYKKRSFELLNENIKIRCAVETEEHGTLDDVKALLRRYEKYRGGISTLNTNFSREHKETKDELQQTKQRTQMILSALEEKVDALDRKLKNKQEELHTLLNYKDKEYPVKAMRIATLQKEIQSLKISNQEDQEDLEHIIYTELSKYEKDRSKRSQAITKEITEKAISMMHPSLKDMALQNMVMSKEIEIHRKNQEQLKQENRQIEEEVQRLLRDPKTNTRYQMFPEFFPQREKCTPDMDVILDIPTQQWLPI